uniref:Uncharacterized protein n=1 Tax=Rhizophagus irregularis (strain DAOM 181602 / DAOM 197198 / MUCL 43194) TaxID=747089 RepID=U9SPN2_RHIID
MTHDLSNITNRSHKKNYWKDYARYYKSISTGNPNLSASAVYIYISDLVFSSVS